MDHWIRLGPSAVQIKADETAPRVSYSSAVWIDHGNEPHYVILKQVVVFFRIVDELIDEELHYV